MLCGKVLQWEHHVLLSTINNFPCVCFHNEPMDGIAWVAPSGGFAWRQFESRVIGFRANGREIHGYTLLRRTTKQQCVYAFQRISVSLAQCYGYHFGKYQCFPNYGQYLFHTQSTFDAIRLFGAVVIYIFCRSKPVFSKSALFCITLKNKAKSEICPLSL